MAKNKATTQPFAKCEREAVWERVPNRVRWVRELMEGLGHGHPIHARRTNGVDTVILQDPGGTEYVVNRLR